MDDPLKALPHRRSAEIDQQSDAQMHQPQIGEPLTLMNRKHLFDRFDLDHDGGLDLQIDTQTVAEGKPVEIE